MSHRCLYVACAFLLWSTGRIDSQTSATKFNHTYEDDRIQVAIPVNWSSKPVYRSDQENHKFRVGVVLSEGSFALYLLTHYGQTSGVIGGRFNEISEYIAPWIKSDEPWACFDVFQQNSTPISNRLVRVDLFLKPLANFKSNDPACVLTVTQVRKPVWAGAYFGATPDSGQRFPGFFLNLPLGTRDTDSDKQMVFAASFQTSTPASLPSDTDPQLRRFLETSDKIVTSIRYK